MKYVNVVGGPGSGKTRLAKSIAEKLSLRYIELDAYNWQKNWQPQDPRVFKETIAKDLENSKNGWVVDGSYHSRLGETIRDRADTIVFLKVPLLITLPRLLRRSFKRLFYRQKLWNGNRETFMGAYSLLKYAITYHKPRIEKMEKSTPSYRDRGINYLVFTRNKQADTWLRSIQRS